MPPSKISFPTIFFTSSIMVLISTSISPVQCCNPNIAPAPSSPNSMLQTACSDTGLIDHAACVRVLQSIPEVASAKGLRNLLIAIIESGISNSTNTRKYIEAASKHTDAMQAGVKDALNDCKEAYDEVVELFSLALRGVKRYDYDYPSYELRIASTDYVILCDSALSKQNVKDEVISRGNAAVPIFGLPANSIVDQLHRESPVAPPPSA